ncbi:hypothetical protein [Bdellovibrio bacteriovorus]|uniref:Integral membrane protein n=1 Tax=Bdellovibrio bacteriovorus str. Tiberius TaxID=1069642 RepID=K7ZA39_BDEBC|nr:hypothetical protein [Bdellovibrio bacteriovorus]AFY01459.1 hypothetical protein Bdt_1769 [Bdellovibrio bacteriovorus str. Tiberius]
MNLRFLNVQNIFLMDAVGALLSLTLTAGILPFLSTWTGLQPSVLYFLAAFPLLYCVFSFICYRQRNQKLWMLLTILFANALYVLVSGAVMLTVQGITVWGYSFLVAEILVLLAVILIEWSVYRSFFGKTADSSKAF